MTPPGVSSCCTQMDRRLAAAMRGVCLAAFALLIVLVTSLILIRFMPLFSLGWADEIVEMAFAWMTFLGTAVLLEESDPLPGGPDPEHAGRHAGGQLLEIGLSLVSLLFLLIFTYEGAVLTLRTAIPSPILALPQALWYLAMPLAGALMVVYTLRDLWHYLHGRITLGSEAAREGHC